MNGALFGCCFPIGATVIDVILLRDQSLTLTNIMQAQMQSPLHWIIDTAPLVIGLFARSAGVRQDRITKINQDLERQKNRVSILARFPDENPSPVIRILADGRVTYANRSATALMEVLRAEGQMESWNPIVECALTTGSSVEIETPWGERTVSLIFAPVLETGYVNIYGRDITERKRALVELERAKEGAEAASRAKSEFLIHMSHELRTPLNAILGFAQILDVADNFPSQHRKALATIAESGELLLTHINDILTISRIEANSEIVAADDFHLHDLLQVLAASFESQITEKGLVWRLDVDAPSEAVRGDENKLRLVLMKLLNNAVKFTDRGSVGLTVRAGDNNQYLFEVADTGVGIQPGMEEEIFETFRQGLEGSNRGGTGLGLAICRHHVRVMAGELKVTSEPGAGSTFSLAVPLPPGRPPVELPGRSHATNDWSRVRHLANGYSVQAVVVDSIKADREILDGILTRVGIDVRAVRNRAECDDLNHEADVVFVEKGALDGNAGDLAGVQDKAKMVAIADSVEGHVGPAQGIDGYLARPLRAAQIYACVAELLGVEYEYRERSRAGSPEPESWRNVHLPETLHSKLSAAINNQSVTELRRLIDLLESELGEAGRPLALHLSELARQYDMDGLRQSLDSFEVNAL